MSLNIIVSRVQNCDFRADRQTPLGNPFKMYSEDQRDKVCEEFRIYFENKVRDNDPEIMNELKKIKVLATNKSYFKIGCHCTPNRCHLDTVAYFLNNYSNSI